MVNGDFLGLKLLDYFTCSIPTRKIKSPPKNKNITKLNLDTKNYIELFKPIFFEKTIIVPRYIEKEGSNYKIMSDKTNLTTLFIRPLVLKYDISSFLAGRILNCYVKYGNIEHSSEFMYVIIKYIADKKMFTYESMLENYSYTMETFDIDPFLMVIKFKIPENFRKDVTKITQGKYSKISDFSKQKILNYYVKSKAISGDPQNCKLAQILNREETLKIEIEETLDVNLSEEAELHEMFNLEKETFYPDLMTIKNQDLMDYKNQKNIQSEII